ncbi:Reverse transcriptase zinc-binding domain [Quillaja saponaria]|uniref:Reverse transcriptase zinc-binding domain n=1 Tax=Quillaja saponaria TaxID=32244 RepID=A0AAD7PJG2_QUISA|nr:Reverse transcriptase zinc-binding domain [Quillaja saponaria]
MPFCTAGLDVVISIFALNQFPFKVSSNLALCHFDTIPSERDIAEIAFLLWYIWKARNDKKFNGISWDVSQVIKPAAYYRNEFRISLEDGEDSRPSTNLVSEANMLWKASSGGTIKINYDAAVDCAHNRGSVGFVARNREG